MNLTSFCVSLKVYPATFRVIELTAEQYFKAPFDAVMSTEDMVSFTLLDDGKNGEEGDIADDIADDVTVNSEATMDVKGSDVLVARTQDVGLTSFSCHTHLAGPRLGAPGDICLGYDLECWNFGKNK